MKKVKYLGDALSSPNAGSWVKAELEGSDPAANGLQSDSVPSGLQGQPRSGLDEAGLPREHRGLAAWHRTRGAARHRVPIFKAHQPHPVASQGPEDIMSQTNQINTLPREDGVSMRSGHQSEILVR